MKVAGEHYRTVWLDRDDPGDLRIIDQRLLPHEFRVASLRSVDEVARAIRDMWVRGAGLIGATAGYGMHLAARAAPRGDRGLFLRALQEAADALVATRPTAVNLAWAVERQLRAARAETDPDAAVRRLRAEADAIADEDADFCRRIGEHGLPLVRAAAERKEAEGADGPVEILTHCNAGWLAFVDHGSATAPIYAAHDAGIDLHVWVDETRPRNQGAALTAWELAEHGVPHTVIVDNAGGHLMQHGRVDLVLVGSDRTSRSGDVGNKIGTYLKALAARDNGVPFYAALPSSTFDWTLDDGVRGTPIEERDAREVTHVRGLAGDGRVTEVRLTPAASPAANWGFDVTPRRLVTGLVTERGVCDASPEGVAALYPERTRDGGAHAV